MRIWTFNHDACMPSTGPLLRHFYFAKELLARDYKATVFASNHIHFNGKCIETGKQKYVVYTEEKVPFVYVKTTPYKGNGLSRIKNMLSYFFKLFSVTRQYEKETEKPDIIIGSSVHPLACVAGIFLARRYKIPCIIEIRDLWPEAIFAVGYIKENSFIGKLLSYGERWIYEHSCAIIFTKEGDVDHIKEMGWDIGHGGKINLKNCFYINNGVNIEDFQANRLNSFADEDLDEESFKLVYTGTIRKINNVDQILDTAKLLQNFTEIKFLIYGTGNQAERLQKRIETERINNVKLKGFIDKKYIPYILHKASVNLLNYSQSQYNWARGNSSNKLFEYMASGRPIISTVTMGYSIIDKYQCGICLSECNAKNLAGAVLNMYHLPEDDYNNLARNAIRGANDFDYKVLTNKLVEVFDYVIKNNIQKEKDIK